MRNVNFSKARKVMFPTGLFRERSWKRPVLFNNTVYLKLKKQHRKRDCSGVARLGFQSCFSTRRNGDTGQTDYTVCESAVNTVGETSAMMPSMHLGIRNPPRPSDSSMR